jgi:hypothetical protein
MAQGTLRKPQDVVWSDTGEVIPGNDPRALNYRQLNAVGAIDRTQPEGTLRNPRVLRQQGDEAGLKPNEAYMDMQGRVQYAPVKSEIAPEEFGNSEDLFELGGQKTGRLTDIPLWQYSLNPSEKSRVDVIRRTIPNAEFSRAEDGRVVVKVGDGAWRYLNAPGASAQDFGDFGNQALLYAPAGLASRGVTGVTQAGLRVGGASAGISAAQDLASEQPIDPVKAAMAFGGGFAGEFVGAGLSQMGGATARAVESATPQPVRNALADLGRAGAGLGRSYGADARTALPPPRQNPLAIPMTRGQQSGDFGQIAFEQAAARGARGEEAQNVLRGFLGEQADTVRATARGFAGSERAPTVGAAGGMVQEAMRDAATSAWTGVNRAYDALKASDGAVEAPNVAKLPEAIRKGLEDEFFSPEVMTSLNPMTRRIFGEIDNLAKSAPDGKSVLPVAGLERVRQAINKSRATAQGNDKAALDIAKREFDGWLAETVDQGLLKGDPEVINLLKTARGLHANYRATFGGGRADDGAQKLMQRLIAANANETDAANLLFGQAQLGGAGQTVQFVRNIKKAADSEAPVAALREGVVMQLLRRMDRQAGGGATNFNYKAIADDWTEALDGKAAPLIKELFTPQEIGEMRRFIGELRRLTPPEGAVNRSGTGYEISRMAGSLLSKLRILAPALKAMDDASNATRAQGAVSPGPPVRLLPGAGAAGGAVGAHQGGPKATF